MHFFNVANATALPQEKFALPCSIASVFFLIKHSNIGAVCICLLVLLIAFFPLITIVITKIPISNERNYFAHWNEWKMLSLLPNLIGIIIFLIRLPAKQEYRSLECLVQNQRESQANDLDEKYFKLTMINSAKILRIDVHQLTWKPASPRPTHPITHVLLSMYPKIFSRHPISNTSLSPRLQFSFCFSQHVVGKLRYSKTGCQSSGPQIPQHSNWKKRIRTNFLKLFTILFPFTSFWTFAHSFSYFS